MWIYLHAFFSGGLRETFFISTTVTFRTFKVHDFGANRKRVCDFLYIVLHSNLGPILHRFRDIARFCAPDPTTIPPNFGVFPLHQIALS